MKSGLILSFLAVIVILLSIFVFVYAKKNHRLEMDKEALILKNDSLHVLQIQTNRELVGAQKRLDSLFGEKGEKKYYD